MNENIKNYDLISYSTLKNKNFVRILQSIRNKQNDYFKTLKGIPVKIDNKSFKIMFGNKLDGYLYRGENDANHLLKTSLQRKNGSKHCIEWCKTYQFIEYLKRTPYYQEFPKRIKIDNYEFAIDLEAIAQHYGYSTYYLDFTQNIEIAEFFAYTEKIVNDVCHPIKNYEREVKIYRIELSKLISKCADYFHIVGFQIVNRALEQEAFALNLKNSQEIDMELFNDYKTYKPEPKRVEEIYKKFDYGKKLFKKDNMDFIRKLYISAGNKDIITENSLQEYSKHFNKPIEVLRCMIEKDCIIADRTIIPTIKDIQIIEQDIKNLLDWINHNIITMHSFMVGDSDKNGELYDGFEFLEANTDFERGIQVISKIMKNGIEIDN